MRSSVCESLGCSGRLVVAIHTQDNLPTVTDEFSKVA